MPSGLRGNDDIECYEIFIKREDNSTGSDFKLIHNATGPVFSGYTYLIRNLTPGNYQLKYRARNYIGPGENSTISVMNPMAWIPDVVGPLRVSAVGTEI